VRLEKNPRIARDLTPARGSWLTAEIFSVIIAGQTIRSSQASAGDVITTIKTVAAARRAMPPLHRYHDRRRVTPVPPARQRTSFPRH
jgi:hypothetical protein